MKLRTKLILSLVLVLVLAVLVVQGVQFYWTANLVTGFSQHNLKLLQERELQQATNLFQTVERAIEGSLIRGEMEKFTRLLESLQQVKGLEDVFLFSADGEVTHASHPDRVGGEMNAEIKGRIFKEGERLTLFSDKALEFYQPHRVVTDCIRCHTTWQPDEIRGVTYYRFSTEALEQARRDSSEALSAIRAGSLYSTGIAVLGVVLIFVLGMLITVRRFITRPMGRLVAALNRYDVDLTLQIPIGSKDEIGQVAELMNRFVGQLNRVIGQAQAVARSVGDKAGSNAAALEQITGSSEIIAASARESADNSQEARELMRSVRSGVTQADEKVGTLKEAMRELSEASSRVADIMRTIDEIAFQTNLLALNAAVEAARAGQAGAGFAVVADEVRSLALRAAEAARSTSEIVEGTISQIAQGEELVEETNEVFGRVREKINRSADLMESVADTSARQRRDIGEINASLQEIDRTTQMNAVESGRLAETMSTYKTDSRADGNKTSLNPAQVEYDPEEKG